MPFWSKIFSFFTRGWFGRSKKETEEFIRRIERHDVDYILNVGVPQIEAPATPGPKAEFTPYTVEGLQSSSLLLADPEALLYIISATEGPYGTIRVSGDGLNALKLIADFSRVNFEKILYVYGRPYSDVEVRFLATRGYVTGVYIGGGRVLRGLEALEELKTMTFDDTRLTVLTVKPRLLEWSDEALSVYVKGLDNQHKYLVNTLNSLYNATVSGEGDKVLSTIIKRLVDYTKFHFKSEEILMYKYNYPYKKYLHHVREHKSFVKTVTEFRDKYESGEAELNLDVFKFLATWIKNHVAGVDRDYGSYFLQIGIANYKPSSSPHR